MQIRYLLRTRESAIVGATRQDPRQTMMAPHLRLSSPETDLLAGLSIFAALAPEELDEVASHLQRRAFAKGEIIYHRDDLPGSLYILVKGQVKIRLISQTDNRQVTFAWIAPGSFFGTISLLDEGHRNSDAVAVEPCQILAMSHDSFRAYLRSHPLAMEALIETMAQRSRKMIRHFYDLAFLDVPGRLAKLLLQLAEDQGQGSIQPPTVLTNLTQRELASLIGTTRESVNKWIKFFVHQGWIEFNRGTVTVLQPTELGQRITA
jgi:CRP/FNR family cyclic AMP-dependent transcriptional regulator